MDHETREPCTDPGRPAFSSAPLSAVGDRRTHPSVDAIGVVLAPGMTGSSSTKLRYMRTCVVSWAHPRAGSAPSNFTAALDPGDSELAQQIAKDPYVFDFLRLTSTACLLYTSPSPRDRS